MVKFLKKIKNTKGYISIESVVVTGVILGFGVIAILNLQNKTNKSVDKSMSSLESIAVQTEMIRLSDLSEGLPK